MQITNRCYNKTVFVYLLGKLLGKLPMKKKHAGFSVMELLIVVIVLSILGAFAVIKYKDLMLDAKIHAVQDKEKSKKAK